MPRLIAVGLLLAWAAGCSCGGPYAGPLQGPAPVYCENPVFISNADHNYVWETTVDVVNKYFRIEREDPVRLVGDVVTEGRLDTFPEMGATVFEPWHRDSVGVAQRVQSTLQTIRRRARLRIIPDAGGYWAEVVVNKEVEDVIHPARATAGAATFRNDGALRRVGSAEAEQDISLGWIPLGRDTDLEQRILAQLQSRLSIVPGRPPPIQLY